MRPAIHPGEVLADELRELGIAPAVLARRINVPANRMSEIVRGRRGVTGDTALRLARFFGMSPQFWLNLQSAHDLRVAEDKAGEEIARIAVHATHQPALINPQE
jgi:antitoxin HigA-1